jgi:uncharacterized protein (DUF1015 family)
LAEIRPFAGVFYRVPQEDLPKVLAPPYDVISPHYRDELYARDPRNIVRVILNAGEGERSYAEAGETYRRLLRDGVLAPETTEALYLLEQGFSSDGKRLRRYGLLARFRAEDPRKGKILPHEHTRTAAKEDRFRLLKATRANFSAIFMMFHDPGGFADWVGVVIAGSASLAFTDDRGVSHRLWRIEDARAIEGFQEALAPARAYIADGHHRYATALRYREEFGPEGAWTLGYFTPMNAPGLLVSPYHRIVLQGPSLEDVRLVLKGRFLLTTATSLASAAREVVGSAHDYAFGFADSRGDALLAESLREALDLVPAGAPASLRVLDTYFLHQAILKLLGIGEDALRFVPSLSELAQGLSEGALGVCLRPTPVEQIVAVAEAGESMPAKSTFFYPKLPSGLVIHPLLA